MAICDRDALEALNRRIDHTAAIARLVSRSAEPADISDAMRGVAETLNEVAEKIDRIINPVTSGGSLK